MNDFRWIHDVQIELNGFSSFFVDYFQKQKKTHKNTLEPQTNHFRFTNLLLRIFVFLISFVFASGIQKRISVVVHIVNARIRNLLKLQSITTTTKFKRALNPTNQRHFKPICHTQKSTGISSLEPNNEQLA